MNSRFDKRLICLNVTLATAVLAACLGSNVTAGEAIQFSSPKTQAEPSAQNSLTTDKLSTLSRMPSSNPFDSINSASPVRDGGKKVKSREETKRHLAELEQKNWINVGKGELQDEEDEKTAFGVRDYDVETAGREKTSTDIWLGTKNHNTRNPGNSRPSGAASRSPGQNRPQPAPASDEADSGLKLGKTSSKSGDQPLGAPGAKERSSQSLLGPDPAIGGLNDTFGNGVSLGDQGRRGDLGLRSIEAPAGSRSSGLGGADALGFGRDLGAKPSLSAAPSLFDAPKSQPSGGSFASPSGSGFGFSDKSFSSAGLNNNSSLAPRGSGFGSSTAPLQQPRNNLSDPFARPTAPSSGR